MCIRDRAETNRAKTNRAKTNRAKDKLEKDNPKATKRNKTVAAEIDSMANPTETIGAEESGDRLGDRTLLPSPAMIFASGLIDFATSKK